MDKVEIKVVGKKFGVTSVYCKTKFETADEAQMMADILNERDPKKAQALIAAKNAKYPTTK